jgi:hypothetical protein
MLAYLGAVVRVLLGFAAACVAAGFIQVLFAVTPAELVAAGEARWSAAVNWAILSSAHIFVFAAPFALISIVISEWLGIRSFAYHTIVAMGIAVAGFGLIMMMETPSEASIVNSYAMAAYLTSGFIAGFVYWVLAGRLALRGDDDDDLLVMEGDDRPPPAKPSEPEPTTGPPRTTGTVPATRPATPQPRAVSSAPPYGPPSPTQSTPRPVPTPLPRVVPPTTTPPGPRPAENTTGSSGQNSS